jgi:23S rRNA pseudouridine2457 synthase
VTTTSTAGKITIALWKPYGFLSRFTPDGSKNRPLSNIQPALPKDVWPVGRLDADSEGLLVLSSDKGLVDRLLSPKRAHTKTYWAQVERVPDEAALATLRAGVILDGERTLPAGARLLEGEPGLPPRDPPIRFRKTVPTTWLELILVEGKNRQVRRMTAAVGHPTLRLVRAAVGSLDLAALGLAPGGWKELRPDEIELLKNPACSTTVRR